MLLCVGDLSGIQYPEAEHACLIRPPPPRVSHPALSLAGRPLRSKFQITESGPLSFKSRTLEFQITDPRVSNQGPWTF